MIRRQYLGRGLGVIIPFIAGCGYVPEGDRVLVSIYGEKDETPSDVALNPTSVSESQFQMKGRLVAEGGKLNKDVYTDVSIQLYSEDGQAICSHWIGTWEGDVRVLSFSSDVIPKYVVVYSPDFWKEPMEVVYFIYDADRDLFVPEKAASADELPVSEIQTELPSCTE